MRKVLLANKIKILPSDNEMCSVGDGALHPTTLKVQFENESFVVLYKDLDKLVLMEMTPFINKKLVSIEVILGGDHGQGAFCWPVKIVLCYMQNQVKSIE